MGMGVFSDKGIRGLIKKGNILSGKKIEDSNIQPSSLDLTLSDEIYCIPYSSLTSEKNLSNYFNSISRYKFDIKRSKFFHQGKIYVARLNEKLKLDAFHLAKSNPKSSIGRTDIHVRLITERGTSFDHIPAGYKGELFLEICSKSFDVLMDEGMSLNQIRIFDKEARKLPYGELESVHRDEGILFKSRTEKIKQNKMEKLLEEDRVGLSLNLKGKFPGYVARKSTDPVDLSKKDHAASEYFELIHLKKEGLTLEEGRFYILNTSELINIPAGYCAEMSDVETSSGEFRAHYAGFFDPGFFAQAVMEVRNLGADFLLKDRQKIATIEFYRMKENPERIYGVGIGSTYQGQTGPKLAKFFDMSK